MKPSKFSIVSFILGVGKGFLRILLCNFLKLEKNCTVLLFFGWMKVGDPHSGIFTFLRTPNWNNCPIYLPKMYSCNLATGYFFAWYGLAYSCISISTGFVFRVPRVL